MLQTRSTGERVERAFAPHSTHTVTRSSMPHIGDTLEVMSMPRIRIYPNYGGYGGYGMMGGLGGAYGPYAVTTRVAQVKLQNERKTSNLRLAYERALWAEKLKSVQLQTAMQYSGYGVASPYAGLQSAYMGGMGSFNPFGMLGGLGLGMF
jgi:hypothetical protein